MNLLSASSEPVELVEAGARRPTVGRPGRAHFPRRDLMVLAEEAGAIAFQPEHLRERCDVVGTAACITGKRGRDLRDPGHVIYVMVVPAQ